MTAPERSIDEGNEDVRAMMSQVLSDTKKMRDFASANNQPYPVLSLGVQEEMYYGSPFISERDGLRAFAAVQAMRTVIKHMVESGYIQREHTERSGNFLYFNHYPESILKEDARRDRGAARVWLWIIAIAVVLLIWLLIF